MKLIASMKTITINIPTTQDLEDTLSRLRYWLDVQGYKLEQRIFDSSSRKFWLLMYRLTGRCGSRVLSHTPIKGNKHRWLWQVVEKDKIQITTCSVCGYSYRQEISLRERNTNYSDIGRQKDIESLKLSLKTATNETEKKAIKKSIAQINHEDRRIKSMRESLIKATRNHDHSTIKDTHEYVASHKALINDR